MKKVAVCFGIILVAAAAIWAVIIALFGEKTDMCFAKSGTAIFKYNEYNISQPLSEQDLDSIIEIFNNKSLYRDNPSCGFTEDVSIQFNESETFCIACDNCPVIYWKNKNRYLGLSDDENSSLRDILKKYGYVFPCV